MYVLIVARGFPSEQYPMNGIFEWDQAKALKANGHRVVYAAIDLRSIRRRRKLGVRNFDSDGVHIFEINIPLGALRNNVLDFVGEKALQYLYKRIIKQYGRPDIIHAHFLKEAVVAANLSKKERIPLVVTEHSSTMNTVQLSKGETKRAKRAYSSANQVITVSERLRSMLEVNVGINSIVIPNIVDYKVFSCTNKKTDKKSKTDFQFVSTGNLRKVKRFDLLINAFSEVLKQYPDSTLRIFGDGPERNNLNNLIIKKGIENQVQLYGMQERDTIAEEYSYADAFVLASCSETFGVSYIEAMAAGLPVIATRCGGPEDFVNDENGILIPVDNKNELIRAMLYVIEHRAEYNSERISKFVEELYSPNTIANELTKVYKDIIDDTKKQAV